MIVLVLQPYFDSFHCCKGCKTNTSLKLSQMFGKSQLCGCEKVQVSPWLDMGLWRRFNSSSLSPPSVTHQLQECDGGRRRQRWRRGCKHGAVVWNAARVRTRFLFQL